MTAWVETGLVFIAAVAAMALGTALGRCGKRSFVSGLAVSFGLIAFTLAGRLEWVSTRWPELFAITASRARFVLLMWAAGIGFGALIEHLAFGRMRQLSCGITALILSALWIFPFVSSAAVQDKLGRLETVFDEQGVCRQTTSFTCGAAAAATGLRHLGVSADEASLAVASRTSPLIGVSAWDLFLAMRSEARRAGLNCSFGFFRRLSDVPVGVVFLAVMRDTAWNDHCVAMLDFSDGRLLVADPAAGLKWMSVCEFESRWRGYGITLYKP